MCTALRFVWNIVRGNLEAILISIREDSDRTHLVSVATRASSLVPVVTCDSLKVIVSVGSVIKVSWPISTSLILSLRSFR